MRARVVVLILCIAATAASLLAVRQRRIQIANELAATHARLVEADEQLLRLRVEVARRLDPDAVRLALDREMDTEPYLLDRCVRLAPGAVAAELVDRVNAVEAGASTPPQPEAGA